MDALAAGTAKHSVMVSGAVVSLVDIVIKAPHLPYLLLADAQKALQALQLSATNRELQKVFTTQVQVMTVFRKDDVR